MARGGKGRRVGGGGPMPDTLGGKLNDYTSWNTVSRGLTGARDLIDRSRSAAWQINSKVEDHKATTRKDEFGRFREALERTISTLPVKLGKDISDAVKETLSSIKDKGGSNISGEQLAPLLQALSSKIDGFSQQSNASILESRLLSNMSRDIAGMVGGAGKAGFNGIGGNIKDIIKTSYDFQANKEIDVGINFLSKSLEELSKQISDSGLKNDVLDLRKQMQDAADAADTSAKKLQVLSTAAAQLDDLKNTRAGGGYKNLIDGIVQGTRQNAEAIEKKNVLAEKQRSSSELKHSALNTIRSIGTVASFGNNFKQVFDAVNSSFQAVNQRVNAFARMQMGISGERGAYGRIMRGAGLNFDNMMAAIGAGRSAGMEDSQVVNQMADLGVNLARARWGEGPMIDNLGKWGLTPFDATGRMKSSEQVMIDMSRKLRSMTDKTEKLQFLTMQGFRPEQMEYVENFERHYDRMQYLKKNPAARGVLERADILDENGMNARIDAATKIELKRRQILNQNAIDEGLWSGLVRSLHPENWFFNDWTARQKGVDAAKSEKAMESLTRELRNVRSQLKENGGSVSGLSRTIEGFGEETLAGMSLTKGWAAADLANRGNQSEVHTLRSLYASQLGLEHLDVTEERNKRYNSAWGMGGGALAGAASGALIGSIIPVVGTAIGGAIGAIIGAIGGGIGMYKSPLFDIAKDGSENHIQRLRDLAKRGDSATISRYLSENNLFGIDASVIKSKDFQDDEKAPQILQGAYNMGLMVDAQALAGEEIDPIKALQFNQDKYYIGNKRRAEDQGYGISRQRVVEAMARSGSGDKTTGVDAESAWNAISLGFDKDNVANQQQIRIERSRLMRGGMDEAKATNMAEAKVKKDWIVENITQQDIDLAKQFVGNDQTRIGTVLAAQRVLDDKKNEKRDRINKYLEHKNIGGQKVKGYSNEINSLSDDALVENIAINTGMSAADVRNNIGTGDAVRKRIFEGSDSYRKQQKEAAEKRKIAEEDKENTINARTYEAAGKMLGQNEVTPTGYLALARQQHMTRDELSFSQSMEEKKKRGGKFSNEEKLAMERLEEKKRMRLGEVNRKQLIKLVAAGGGKLAGNFSAEEIAAFNASEAEEKELFLSNSKNNEGRYQNFKNIQSRMLQGQTVTDEERAWYNAEENKIKKARRRGEKGRGKKRKGAAAFEEEYVPTAEEAAAIEETKKRSQQLSKERDDTKGKRSLNQMATFRQINELRRQGMNDKDIFKRFGRANYQAYKEAVHRGEITDSRNAISKVEKRNDQQFELHLGGVRNKKGELLSREEYEKRARESAEAAGLKGDSFGKAVTEKMKMYDAYKNRLDAREAAKRKRAGVQARAAKKGNFNPPNIKDIDQEPGYLVSAANEEAKEEQASEAMRKASSAAEKAAASGNEKKGGDTTIQNNTTTNVEAVNLTQNFNGPTPDNAEAVGDAAREGMKEGVNGLTDAINRNNGNRGNGQ